MAVKSKDIYLKSAKMISWQVDCVEEFERMDKGETLVICSQRQVGKSFTCSQILLYTALNNRNSTSIYVSPTNDSSRKFFTDIKKMVEDSGLVRKLNESLLIIEFINGSQIVFRSAESKLRGYSCKKGGILVVDEAYYVPDDIWEVVLPFTNVDHSKKVFISTPRFKTGFFWDCYQRGQDNEKGYHLISTQNYDTSMFLTDEQKLEYRRTLSPQAFKSEILGEWLDSGEGLFGDYASIFLTPEDREPEVVGIDWSNNGGDNTVLSGFNKHHQHCMLNIVTNIEDPVQRAIAIANIINEHPSIKTVVAETNSIGEVYISILKKHLKRPQILKTFTTTNDSKKRIIEKMIAAIGSKFITLLPNTQLEYEMSIYEMESLKNGNYTYNGKKDDCIMATAFAIDTFYETTTGTYMIRGSR